jgi:PAS domain S-box-containing protein
MREWKLDIPFIVITGAITEDVAVEFMKQGASDYLLKDRLARLGQAAVKALEQRELREEKRRAKETLRREYERRKDLEDIVNRSPIVIFLWRNELGWPVEMVSENVKIFGYSADDFISERIHYADIIHPDDLRRIENEVCQHTVQGDSEFVQNYRIITKDGQIRWVDDRTTVRQSPSGERTHYQGIIMDITSRMQTEEALRENEERFRHISELIPDFAYSGRKSPDGPFTIDWITGGVEKITGYTTDEIYVMTCWRPLVVEDDVPIFDKNVVGLSPGESIRSEIRIRKKDGGIVWLASFVECITDHQNPSYHRIYGGCRDITERKRTEEALKESEARHRTILQTAMDGFWLADTQGRLLDVNETYCRMSGYSAQELLAMRISDLEASETADDTAAHMQEIMARGEDRFESWHRRKDGSIFAVEVSVQCRTTESGGVVAFLRDITERKRAEEALVRKSEDLARSNAELAQFAYVSSHDLKEPLRMVTSYVQLLEERYKGKLDPDADEFIGYAVEGTKRMRQLLNALLNYSGVSTRGNPLQTVESETVLETALQNLKIVLEETKGTVTHDPLPVIIADETQMVQLFQNLIGNGLKFHGPQPPLIHVSAKQEGTNWIFSFQDNGIGIDPQYFEKIFVIFQRLHTRDKYPGLGIGLAIAKKIVEQHGGRIWAESEKEKGSAFYFTIPVDGFEEGKNI